MLVVKTLIFTVLVPGTVTVLMPLFLTASALERSFHAPTALRLLGVLAITAGVAVYIWCASDFILAGRGTPNPLDPPKRLVSRGLYQWMRNPMYVGIGLILAGEALCFGSLTLLVYAGVVLSLFHLRVLLYEEPRLRKQFGASYDEYCKAVPRWFPRWRY